MSTITNRLANTILTGQHYSVLVKEVIKASVHENLINTIFKSRNSICAYYLRSSHRPESRSLYTVSLIIRLRCMGNQHSANITTKQKTVFATSRRCVKKILHSINCMFKNSFIQLLTLYHVKNLFQALCMVM